MLNITHLGVLVRVVLLCFLIIFSLRAQPKIGYVEIFGIHHTSKSKVLKTLKVKSGDPLPKSKGDVEEKLEEIDGVLAARLEAYCCDNGSPILYVGLEERGAPSFQFRPITIEDVGLPEEIVSTYQDFAAALGRAVAAGETAEDLSAGHSIMANLPCRLLQEQFVGQAQLNTDILRRTMLGSLDSDQRAIAAYVYGYSSDKKAAVPDLQLALRDPDPGVRANASRALKAIAVYARDVKDPEKRPVVRPTWFVEMLNSIVLSDRLEGAKALNLFLEGEPDPTLVAHIKERALPSLLEMARWRHLPHSLPAFVVVGRLCGQDEIALMRMWVQDRETAMNGFEKTLTKKK